VESVTGPNVGIVGPTVLGGKGQEVQPSGQELQSTEKEQRDVSSLRGVYSRYEELPRQQDESKGQADAAYSRYAASLRYRGLKYAQSQSQETQPQARKPHKKFQRAKTAGKPTTQRAAHYRSEEPENHSRGQERYHKSQDQNGQSPSQIYQQVQNQQPREGSAPENQVKSGASNTSQESQPQEGSEASPPKEAPIFIPQEYLQYQLAPQEVQVGNSQPSVEFLGNQQLQLFLPQEATGVVNGHDQVPRLEPVQNGQLIQYIPTYATSQPASLQREHQSYQSPVQIIRQPQELTNQPLITFQNSHASNPVNPSVYRPQPHPVVYPAQIHPSKISALRQSQSHQSLQLQSDFQPSQFQSYSTDKPQYRLQHSNSAQRRPGSVNSTPRRPESIYIQQKPSLPTVQLAQNSPVTQSAGTVYQPQSFSPSYRPRFSERLPQRQPEHLSLVSPSPLKMTQQRQTHDQPPTHQSVEVYRLESLQTANNKPDPLPQVRPHIPKIQTPQYIQTPSAYADKVVTIQPQVQIPQTQYELSDGKMAQRPLLYPIPTQSSSTHPTKIPHHTSGVERIPSEAAKLYNIKIPTYLKALEQQSGQSKPFGFSQMSFGDKPGSYSYSIFNKHS